MYCRDIEHIAGEIDLTFILIYSHYLHTESK